MRAIPQSIRGRLLAWHGGMLLIVLAAFGATAFQLVRENHLKRLDAELQRRMTMVVSAIGPRPRVPVTGNRAGALFRLSPEHQALFEGEAAGSFYYVVWLAEGEPSRASSNAPPAVPMPDLRLRSSDATLRNRGNWRELELVSPRVLPVGARGPRDRFPRGVVVVGCSLEGMRAELRHLAWWLAAAGGGILALGLLTAGWLSTRALSPIGAISATAKTIAGGNLSERISLAETEGELGDLAQVLNETFDRLQSASARQAQFTADASHELRTPTFVILSQAQSALKRERSAAEYREGFEVCQRAARQMGQLIDSLLLLARHDAGEAKPRREPCELDRIAAQAIELLRPLAEARKIVILPELAPAPMAGDALALRQVVGNLVGNAIEYHRPNGEVRVRVGRDENGVVLVVRDNGPGIDAEDLPRIFDRFYRADKSRGTTQGHAGLGLAICLAVVRVHDGTLVAESRPGEGAVFTARFPV